MDIKEDNVIINERMELKIIDFGLAIAARVPGVDEPYHRGFGTILYMSPELQHNRR